MDLNKKELQYLLALTQYAINRERITVDEHTYYPLSEPGVSAEFINEATERLDVLGPLSSKLRATLDSMEGK